MKLFNKTFHYISNSDLNLSPTLQWNEYFTCWCSNGILRGKCFPKYFAWIIYCKWAAILVEVLKRTAKLMPLITCSFFIISLNWGGGGQFKELRVDFLSTIPNRSMSVHNGKFPCIYVILQCTKVLLDGFHDKWRGITIHYIIPQTKFSFETIFWLTTLSLFPLC